MADRNLNLDEFSRLVNVEVEKFKDRWKKGQKKTPDTYPKQLNEADWWEQFMSHLGSGNGART